MVVKFHFMCTLKECNHFQAGPIKQSDVIFLYALLNISK